MLQHVFLDLAFGPIWATSPPSGSIASDGRSLGCLGERSLKRFRVHRRGEHAEGALARGLLALFRGAGGAVGERDDVEALLEGGAHGRFNATVRQEARKCERLDAVLQQLLLQICSRKRIEPALP